ncbi:hypothetical protein [Caballeronia sp. M23-90]
MTISALTTLNGLFERHAALRQRVDDVAPEFPDGLARQVRLLLSYTVEYGQDRHVRLDTLGIAQSMLMLKRPGNALDRVLCVLLQYKKEDDKPRSAAKGRGHATSNPHSTPMRDL